MCPAFACLLFSGDTGAQGPQTYRNKSFSTQTPVPMFPCPKEESHFLQLIIRHPMPLTRLHTHSSLERCKQISPVSLGGHGGSLPQPTWSNGRPSALRQPVGTLQNPARLLYQSQDYLKTSEEFSLDLLTQWEITGRALLPEPGGSFTEALG